MQLIRVGQRLINLEQVTDVQAWGDNGLTIRFVGGYELTFFADESVYLSAYLGKLAGDDVAEVVTKDN